MRHVLHTGAAPLAAPSRSARRSARANVSRLRGNARHARDHSPRRRRALFDRSCAMIVLGSLAPDARLEPLLASASDAERAVAAEARREQQREWTLDLGPAV